METLELAVNARELIRTTFKLSEEHEHLVYDSGMYDNWYSGFASFKEVFTLSELPSKYENGEVSNFVYYRPAELVFSTLVSSDHADFMAGIYTLHHLKEGTRSLRVREDDERLPVRMQHLITKSWDAQDNYLFDCLGMYQSSCSNDVYRHTKFEMNAKEYDVFRNFRHHTYSWEESK